MPTYSRTSDFVADCRGLTEAQRVAFKVAVRKFTEDLQRGEIRAGLRVKRVRRREGVWELTWAPDGRATFEYGPEDRPGQPHIVWRRIGGHDILDNP